MKLKTIIFMSLAALLFIALYGSKTVFGVNQGLSEAEVSKKYNITFPVTELNNCGSIEECCKSKEECISFCNQSSNQNVCLQYAKEHNISVDFKGPGGCTSIDSCISYCKANLADHECQKYAGQYGGGIKDSNNPDK